MRTCVFIHSFNRLIWSLQWYMCASEKVNFYITSFNFLSFQSLVTLMSKWVPFLFLHFNYKCVLYKQHFSSFQIRFNSLSLSESHAYMYSSTFRNIFDYSQLFNWIFFFIFETIFYYCGNRIMWWGNLVKNLVTHCVLSSHKLELCQIFAFHNISFCFCELRNKNDFELKYSKLNCLKCFLRSTLERIARVMIFIKFAKLPYIFATHRYWDVKIHTYTIVCIWCEKWVRNTAATTTQNRGWAERFLSKLGRCALC